MSCDVGELTETRKTQKQQQEKKTHTLGPFYLVFLPKLEKGLK